MEAEGVRMTAAQVLESLQNGPKTYSQLRGLCGNLDFLIAKLLKTREIVFTPDGERAMYMLPKPPPVDGVLRPCRKVLSLGKPRKRKNQYDFDTGGRKRCAVCSKRKGRSRYMYGGKVWGTCFECREKPEAAA